MGKCEEVKKICFDQKHLIPTGRFELSDSAGSMPFATAFARDAWRWRSLNSRNCKIIIFTLEV